MVQDQMAVDGSIGGITNEAAAVVNAPANVAAMSMEQLYSPILIRRGLSGQKDDRISAFEVPEDTQYTSSVFGGEHPGPTRQELDPYFTTVLDGDDNTPMKVCDFHFGNWFTKTENNEPLELNLRKTTRDIDAALVPHFRGPMILSGWGFDHADLPVPYYTSNDVPDGETGGYVFDTNFINNRATWKSGPVDLKWDYQRKVWGAGHQILVGVADQDITAPDNPCVPTCFRMKVLRRTLPPEIEEDEAGNPTVTNWHLCEEITVFNRDPSLEQPLILNKVFVIAVRVNYEWLPLWVGCPGGEDCPGGSSEFTNDAGSIISSRGDCFCFLSAKEEELLFSKSTAEDCEEGDNDAQAG